MRRSAPAANPDAYVAALDGWRRARVEELRAAVREAAPLDEVIKWGHLVYLSSGPVLLIRAEEERVLFGFWRGQRLRHIEPRLKPGGKYEMATLELREGATLDPQTVRLLTREASRSTRRRTIRPSRRSDPDRGWTAGASPPIFGTHSLTAAAVHLPRPPSPGCMR